jgi:flagellar biosynthetic protein FliO
LDTVFLALRVVVALGAVFGALLLAHRWITKGRPGSAPRNKQISMVARQSLGAKAGIAVVDAGGKRYLLGVTEHAVTVLDTLGAAQALTGEPALVASQPIAVARFEQELRTVTIATADVPIMVQGGADPEHPGGPITQTVAILPGPTTAGYDALRSSVASVPSGTAGLQTAAPMTGTITLSSLVNAETGAVSTYSAAPSAQAAPVYTSRRAMREAEAQAAAAPQPAAGQPGAQQAGPLAGSVLSPATWKQTFDALKKLR